MGNICYAIISIQVLTHINNFINKFTSKINSKSFGISIAKDLNNVYGNMLYYNNNFIDISYFIKNFWKIHINFQDNNQHDLQEFIRVLLDDIRIELNDVDIKPKYKEIFLSRWRYDIFCHSREKSIIINLCYMQ